MGENLTTGLDSLLGNLAISTYQRFLSLHCLISGMSPKYIVDGNITSAGVNKIRLAVKEGIDGKDPGPSAEEIDALSEGRKNPIEGNFSFFRREAR